MAKMRDIKVPVFGIEISVDDENHCGTIKSTLKEDNREDQFNAAMDAIEALVLAHAVEGIRVEYPNYFHGIEAAVDACINHFV